MLIIKNIHSHALFLSSIILEIQFLFSHKLYFLYGKNIILLSLLNETTSTSTRLISQPQGLRSYFSHSLINMFLLAKSILKKLNSIRRSLIGCLTCIYITNIRMGLSVIAPWYILLVKQIKFLISLKRTKASKI